MPRKMYPLLAALLLALLSLPAHTATFTAKWDQLSDAERVVDWKVRYWLNNATRYHKTVPVRNGPSLRFTLPAKRGDVVNARVRACNSEGCSVWTPTAKLRIR